MGLSTIASAVGIASGVNSLLGGGGGGSSPSAAASTAAGYADPASGYRPGWAAQLNQLLTGGPSALASTQGYQDFSQQSVNALQRQLASTGQTFSGNERVALDSLNRSSLLNYWQSMISPLEGVIGTPSGAASGYLGGLQTGSQIQGQGLANIMGGIGALGQIYGGNTSTWQGAGMVSSGDYGVAGTPSFSTVAGATDTGGYSIIP